MFIFYAILLAQLNKKIRIKHINKIIYSINEKYKKI